MTASRIYIFDDKSGLADSTLCLLESQQFNAIIFKDEAPLKGFPEFTTRDTVVIHLNDDEPNGFKLLNTLIFRTDRPNIVLTTDFTDIFYPGDYFPGDRVTVLNQPVQPNDLVHAITPH